MSLIESDHRISSASSMHRYPFKPDCFSSHSLLTEEFEDVGNGRRVLDVGCGSGHLARILAKRGYKVTGVDKDGDALSFAVQWCCDVIEADLENWAGPGPQQFDYILLADVLEHLRDPLSVVQRLMLFLNEHGIVVLSVPNVAHLYVRLMLLCGRWDYADRGILDRTHLRFFTRASLMRFLCEAEICLRRIRPASLPWSAVASSIPEQLLHVLSSIDHLAASLWPTVFAYQWVVSGTKERRYG